MHKEHLFFQVYKRKNEAAKRDYLKALAEYRAGHFSQVRPSDWWGVVHRPLRDCKVSFWSDQSHFRLIRSQNYNHLLGLNRNGQYTSWWGQYSLNIKTAQMTKKCMSCKLILWLLILINLAVWIASPIFWHHVLKPLKATQQYMWCVC